MLLFWLSSLKTHFIPSMKDQKDLGIQTCFVRLLPFCTHIQATYPSIIRKLLQNPVLRLHGSKKKMIKDVMETQNNLYSAHLCCVPARSLCTHIKTRICRDGTFTLTRSFRVPFTKTHEEKLAWSFQKRPHQ